MGMHACWPQSKQTGFYWECMWSVHGVYMGCRGCMGQRHPEHPSQTPLVQTKGCHSPSLACIMSQTGFLWIVSLLAKATLFGNMMNAENLSSWQFHGREWNNISDTRLTVKATLLQAINWKSPSAFYHKKHNRYVCSNEMQSRFTPDVKLLYSE